MRYPDIRRSAAISSLVVLTSILVAIWVGAVRFPGGYRVSGKPERVVILPEPSLKGEMSVEEAIYRRRSIRDYTGEPISLRELGQILWAAQGITLPSRGFRAAPSAGATYPLEIYVSVREGGVTDLAPGIYHYDPFNHVLTLVRPGDHSRELARAALDQRWVREGSICLIIAADFERTTSVYGERGIRYVYMEAGHVGQNIYLQATSLGLGTVAVGAFYDEEVRSIVGCAEQPIYLFPVGRRA